MMLHQLRNGVLWALILLLAGCAGSGRLRYDTPEEAFQRGLSLFERGKYDRAAEYFQGVFDFGRTHEWADDAQLYLARSYRASRQHILAASEYNRFIELYRNDPRVVEAEFERAMSFYERSPNYELDQSPTEQAIQNFNLFISRYPTSDLVPRAEQYVAELREKLALKQYDTALLYERRSLYEAAALSFESVFDKYPDTKWADDALLGAIRTYIAFAEESIVARQADRLQLAVEHYRRLLQLFPDSPLLKDAEDFYEQAADRLDDLQQGS